MTIRNPDATVRVLDLDVANPLSAGAVLLDIKRGVTDYETRLDYDGRTDDQPVYVGRASSGASVALAEWTIEKVTYDGNDRPTRKQVLDGVSWNDRAVLSW